MLEMNSIRVVYSVLSIFEQIAHIFINGNQYDLHPGLFKSNKNMKKHRHVLRKSKPKLNFDGDSALPSVLNEVNSK